MWYLFVKFGKNDVFILSFVNGSYSSVKKYLPILDFYLCYLFIQTSFICQEDLNESLTAINGEKMQKFRNV